MEKLYTLKCPRAKVKQAVVLRDLNSEGKAELAIPVWGSMHSGDRWAVSWLCLGTRTERGEDRVWDRP